MVELVGGYAKPNRDATEEQKGVRAKLLVKPSSKQQKADKRCDDKETHLQCHGDGVQKLHLSLVFLHRYTHTHVANT